MSRFFSSNYSALEPYTPGEQPQSALYIKLNTNESPFPPPQAVREAVAAESGRLQLYSDPECSALIDALARTYKLRPAQLIAGNGSDELLNFAFMAFADSARPLVFPDVTYGFYPVFARLNAIPFEEIPLREDFSVRVEDYIGVNKTVVIANPNAPTGLCLGLSEIERIAASNPDNAVIIDEAYVDFGGESAMGLTERYENLLIIQTFSKSRSMAGARLGFAAGSEALIADLNAIRCSVNPYNVNRMTGSAGVAALGCGAYYRDNCRRIEANRAYTAAALEKLGFTALPSKANFLFAASPDIGGGELYEALKRRNILVRHFSKPRIDGYIRVTIGTMEQMTAFLQAVEQIVKERRT